MNDGDWLRKRFRGKLQGGCVTWLVVVGLLLALLR